MITIETIQYESHVVALYQSKTQLMTRKINRSEFPSWWETHIEAARKLALDMGIRGSFYYAGKDQETGILRWGTRSNHVAFEV